MSEIARIQNQLKRTFEAGAWHGASVQETLSGITAEMASAKPIQDAHTIWEIVLHMITWIAVPTQRIIEEKNLQVGDEVDWPAATESGDAAWKDTLAKLNAAYNRLQETLSRMKDSDLEHLLEGAEKTPIYVMLHGVIQHNLYHAGQINILKKAL